MTTKKAIAIFIAVVVGFGLLFLLTEKSSRLSSNNAGTQNKISFRDQRPDSTGRPIRHRDTVSPSNGRVSLTPELLRKIPTLYHSTQNPENDLDSLVDMGLNRGQAFEVHERLAAAYASLSAIREANTIDRFRELQDVVNVPRVSSEEFKNVMSGIMPPIGTDPELFATIKEAALYQFDNIFSNDQTIRLETSGPQYTNGSSFRFLVTIVGDENQQASYDAMRPAENWMNFLVTDDLKKLYGSVYARAQK